ncbi:RNA polymerase sigma-70 factor [Algoriphagus aquimarinus]|uniref:RNA polymerase sigma-70 factor n=1 Tax=Algoriphagus aquimarinus TaxID=237018 RepID=A0A5C7AY64_9BACT|nr:RNA polymerase sigma-70 factor [Algoriphagus aquimarinus]TXE13746.1 RNA polymerase sigma-70 factor [Algoriphagus aquimarinus]
MTSTETNKILLNRISVNSDKTAFSELFKRYHSKLVSFATCFLPHFDEAEDMVSEVFIRLLKNHKNLKDIENFEGYLYYAVKNQCLNQLKKNKRKNSLFTPLDIQDCRTGEYTQPLEQLLTSELREKIADCVNRLPQKRRLVYKMIKDDGLSIKKTANLLDIADKTVKKHLELAVREIRIEIQQYLSNHSAVAKVIPISAKLSNLGVIVLGAWHFLRLPTNTL